ncbi:MAG: pyrimidine dimer DNA glycosylase/endonuclease V [archaeon]|jgi:deoxyribonuclease (pyrimidine dimer)|nr:pyrimidine dimer DNA glycosylase/endonuclease V [archaeon]
MVRINLIRPRYLTDQHLIAEYNEILMFLGYVRKNPVSGLENIPQRYKLGKGHILFFKNKLIYIKKRFSALAGEMRLRGFKTNRLADISKLSKHLKNDWLPDEKDIGIIRKRIIEKIKLKPHFYRYYGETKPMNYLIRLIKYA